MHQRHDQLSHSLAALQLVNSYTQSKVNSYKYDDDIQDHRGFDRSFRSLLLR